MKNKNIALIIAGGVGSRMGASVPKQFIKIDNKPVIIYTLECFQNHEEIDEIYVVCVDGWQETLKDYCVQYGISKLCGIIDGGENGMKSIYNGIVGILGDKKNNNSLDDIVLIHDGIRPLVSDDIISNNITICKTFGNSITAINCAEAMLLTENQKESNSQINRDRLMRTQTPQTFYLKDILELHNLAIEKNIKDSTASCTLAVELGKTVFFTLGSLKNIKLTTPDDIDLFKALLLVKKDGRKNRD